jgi:hypothetical protein
MISGATRGAGGKALGMHLSNATKNELVQTGESRGLFTDDIKDQIAELTSLASHAKTLTPLYHVHADPPEDMPWSEKDRARYWKLFEEEFKLSDRPFASVTHLKYGRAHEHRVYLAIDITGKAVRFDHDYARREKVNRIFELE